MKTDLVNNIANEVLYQLQFYKNLYFTQKMITKNLLITFSTIIIRLIAFHVFYFLNS